MSASAPLQHRLSEQLQALSLVGETLTLRLLELEERLGQMEERLLDLVTSPEAEVHGLDTGEVLALTEERIARLEALLGPPAGRAVTPRMAAVPRLTSVAPPGLELGDPDLEGCPDEPFPEEGEQPFMDELSA